MDDWKDRLEDEVTELSVKLEKLEAFLDLWLEDGHPLNNTYFLMVAQVDVMRAYVDIIHLRMLEAANEQ